MVGVYICEHHGRAGLADVCIHVAEAVSSGSQAHDVVSAHLRITNFGNQAAEMILTLSYCHSCATDYGFPTRNSELQEAALEAVLTRGQFTGVCRECLNDVM